MCSQSLHFHVGIAVAGRPCRGPRLHRANPEIALDLFGKRLENCEVTPISWIEELGSSKYLEIRV